MPTTREGGECMYGVCMCVCDPISPPTPFGESSLYNEKSLVILTISKSKGGKKLKYPGIYVEEEKVFVNFSAMLSINVIEVKFWQNFNLTVRKLQTQLYSKVVLFCFNYCTMGDKSIKYVILNR